MKQYHFIHSNSRLAVFAVLAAILISAQSGLYADAAAGSTISWNPSQTSSGGSDFWKGISSVYGLVYGLFWVGASIAVGMGWFKFKKGDVQAALFSLGGGAGLGVTPFLIQWFRSLGSNGTLF